MALIEIEGVCKHFMGRVAIDNCTFGIEAGKIYGIIGPNGAGKTTLLNCITGFLNPDQGSIRFKGKNIEGLLPHQTCGLGIARTFQKGRPLPGMTVLENVMVGAFRNSRHARDAREKAKGILRFTSLYDVRHTLAVNLNTGGRKKMELARCLATDPEVLLLDEMVAGINLKDMEEIVKLLKAINSQGITLVAVEHVMDFIMSVSDVVIVLNKGELICKGVPREVICDPNVIEAYLGKPYVKNQ